MASWIEAVGKVVTDFAVLALDLIEGAWKKATGPRG